MGIWALRRRAPRYLALMQGLWWDPDPRVFHESWSLCVEEWFYLSFALLAFAGRAVLTRDRSYLLAASTVACGSLGLRIFLVLVQGRSVHAVRYSTLPHLDSLMFGVIAAYAAARWPARWDAVAYSRRSRASRSSASGLGASGLALRIECRDANPVLRCGRARDRDAAAGLSVWRIGPGAGGSRAS